MGYFKSSKLLEKLDSLQTEYEKLGTSPERKHIIEKHMEQLKRDVERLGIREEDKVGTEKKT